ATSTQLLQNGSFNASGTITQNGVAVSTATNTLSLTNGSGYLNNASITALSPIVWSSTSTISCPTCSTGGTPSGTANNIQFNNNTAFGGIPELTYNTSTGQTKFTAQTTGNYGGSQSTGGMLNITGSN